MNFLLTVAVLIGIGLFAWSFDPNMDEKRSASLASIGGLIPLTALFVERIFTLAFGRKK